MSERAARLDTILGPLLILDDISDGQLHLAAVFAAPRGVAVGPITAAGRVIPTAELLHYGAVTLHRARFSVPAEGGASYEWVGTRDDLAADLRGDLRIAYASCNGEENGDMDRDPAEREVMWGKLRAEHRAAPFALLLHGFD